MTSVPNKLGAQLTIGAGVAIALASFLPWAKVTAPFIGSVEITGMDGGDGVFSLLGGGLLVALGWSALNGSRPQVTTVLLAVAVGVLALVEVGDLSSRGEDIGDYGRIDYGIGLYLLFAGAGVALIGGVKMPVKEVRTSSTGGLDSVLDEGEGSQVRSLDVLTEMHLNGDLDDAEFSAAKRQLLGLA